jgi:DNA-binding response OmpR family regulator
MRSKKIVVVDNDNHLLTMFEQQLRAVLPPGYTVLTEDCGDRTLALLERHSNVMTLLVSDALKDMNSFEMARQVRRLSPQTKIFMMSLAETSTLETKANRMHLELDGYFNKVGLYLDLLETESRTDNENSYRTLFETQ